MRLIILTSKATSLLNVSRDIAYVASKIKITPRIIKRPVHIDDIDELCDICIMVYPASPLFCTPYFLFYRDWKTYIRKPIIFYTTIEGRPTKRHISKWMVDSVEFVANSKYTYDRLVEVGFSVKGIVPHGIVRETVEEAKKLVPTVRKELEKIHQNKVIFGAVAFYHIRKGLNYLARAVNILQKKRDDFVVHLVTSRATLEAIKPSAHLYIDTVFGTRSREEILAFLGACDFVIIPSLAEGFGLPLLEANAMGTPSLYCRYEPLTEVGDPQYNLTFDYEVVRFCDIGEGIEYELHIYNPKKLAEMMDYAIDMYKKDYDTYKKASEQVKGVIEKFDAEKVYLELFRLLAKK